jgi:hypothetical protein
MACFGRRHAPLEEHSSGSFWRTATGTQSTFWSLPANRSLPTQPAAIPTIAPAGRAGCAADARDEQHVIAIGRRMVVVVLFNRFVIDAMPRGRFVRLSAKGCIAVSFQGKSPFAARNSAAAPKLLVVDVPRIGDQQSIDGGTAFHKRRRRARHPSGEHRWAPGSIFAEFAEAGENSRTEGRNGGRKTRIESHPSAIFFLILLCLFPLRTLRSPR